MPTKEEMVKREELFRRGLKYCSSPTCTVDNPQPVDNFNNRQRGWHGLSHRCRTCHSLDRASDKYKERINLREEGLKRCPGCDIIKPIDDYFRSSRAAGVSYRCKECCLGKNRKSPTRPVSRKTCSQCGITKPVEEFSKKHANLDGYDSRCKACIQAAQASPEQRAKARLRAKQEKYRAYHREYKKTDKGRSQQKRWNRSPAGRASLRRTTREWAKKTGFYRTIKSKRHGIIRRTKISAAGGSFSAAEWKALCVMYDYRCLCCGDVFDFKELTVDHVVPVSKGGTSNIDNLQPLCRSCNSSKKDQTIDYRTKKVWWKQLSLL